MSYSNNYSDQCGANVDPHASQTPNVENIESATV